MARGLIVAKESATPGGVMHSTAIIGFGKGLQTARVGSIVMAARSGAGSGWDAPGVFAGSAGRT
jgi:hypothetical protein